MGWRQARLLLLLLSCGLLGHGTARAERPFVTQEAETLAAGQVTLDVGLMYRNEPRDFGIPDRDHEVAVADLMAAFGIGKVAELQVRGQPVVVIDRNGETSTDNGDWVFGTKIWIVPEKKRRPSISFLYEVKLPNASDDQGVGTDETDFLGYFLFSKGIGERDILHGNIGLGILGDPLSNSSQNDVAVLNFAWERRIGERNIYGLEALMTSGPDSGDDPRFLRGNYARRLGNWAITAGLSVGVGDDADNFRLDAGFRRRFTLRPIPDPPRRNDW